MGTTINRNLLLKSHALFKQDEGTSNDSPVSGKKLIPTSLSLKRDGDSGAGSSGPGANPVTAAASRKVRFNDPTTLQLARRTNLRLDTFGQGDTTTRDPMDPNTLEPTSVRRRSFTLRDQPIAPGEPHGPQIPRGEKEGWTQGADGKYTFEGTLSDDKYHVTEEADGSVSVTNGAGKVYKLGAEEAKAGVTIDAGFGNDDVTFENKGFNGPKVKVMGGDGDDTIKVADSMIGAPIEIEGGAGNDNITGGSGLETIDGGEGDDTIDAGAGNDLVRGGEGNDTIKGGEGHDLIQGGAGADQIDAGTGADVVYGDREDQSIDAGQDDEADLVITEKGSVRATNMTGKDRQLDFDPDAVDEYLKSHPELKIEGSDEFQARTRADLGVMLGTDQGQMLLGEVTEALQARGESLTFKDRDQAGGEYVHGTNELFVGSRANLYADGSTQHPLPVMFHELVHARQDLVTGRPEGATEFEGPDGNTTQILNDERQAAGLSWIDKNGVTHSGDEYDYTDNKFRSELGLPTRTKYGSEGDMIDPTAARRQGAARTGEA